MEHKTIGYHTVSDNNTPAYIETHAPFISSRDKPFLSEGYYFWENDIDSAHDYGIKHYGEDGYVICECALHLSKMLDLMANQLHVKELKGLEAALHVVYGPPQNQQNEYPLNVAISLLKKYNKKEPGVFDYDSVRTAHTNPKNFKTWNFVDGIRESAITNLRIMICVFEKTTLILPRVSIVYPPDYV